MWFPSWLRTVNSSHNPTRTRPMRRKSGAAPRRARLLVEALEDRSVPSAVASVNCNTLTITDPDLTGHTINVTQTAVKGQFQVESPDTSIVSPSGTILALPGNIATFNGVANIAVGLGADSDTLNFTTTSATTSLSGHLAITAGDGNNSVNLALNAIGGNLSVNEGNGEDVFVLNTSVHGNASVTQGSGADAVLIEPGAMVSISGNLTVNQGSGSLDSVWIEQTTDASALAISGNFSITQNGASAQVVSYPTLTISGNFSVTQNGGGGYISVPPGEPVAVGGNFCVSQADSSTVIGFSESVSVFGLGTGGNISITQGKTEQDSLLIGYSKIGGNVSLSEGDGPEDTIQVFSYNAGPIGGNVSVTQGNGNYATVILMDGSVRGRVSVSQGDGNVAGIGLGNLHIGGNLSLTQGNGVEDGVFFNFGGAVVLGGNLSLTQGNGDTDLVDFEDINVAGKTAISLGNGNSDEVDIEGGPDFVDGVGVKLSGNVSINFGNSGTDTLSIGTDGDPVVFAAKATFSAGAPGNTYVQGPFVGFPLGQPIRHNFI